MHRETREARGSDKKIGGTVAFVGDSSGGLNFVTFLMLAHRTSSAMNGTGWKYD
jgi:hypothetical protein